MGPILQWTAGQPLHGGSTHLAYGWAQALLPGFGRLWWPYRLQALAVAAAAGGAAALLGALPRRWAWGVAAGVAAMSLTELRLAQANTHGRLLWDAPAPVMVPAIFDALAEAPGEHPLLLLPLQGPTSSRVLWQAYHRQPVSAGLGDAEDFLLPQAVVQQRQSSRALRQLRELARRPPNDPLPRGQLSLRADLQAAGFSHAVLWRDPPLPAQTEAAYRELLGGEPDHVDALVAVWDLR